jgi:CHAD domain-containing protein
MACLTRRPGTTVAGRSKPERRRECPTASQPTKLLAEAFTRTAREQLDHAQAALSDGIAADPAEAVHQARKAIKKERALLRLMRGAVSPRRRRAQNTALRDAARRLSGTRDAVVMVGALDDLAERYAGQVPQATFLSLRNRIAAETPVLADLSGEGPEVRAASQLAQVSAELAGWRLRRDGFAAIDDGLMRTYRRGRRTFAVARRHRKVENLHNWRKRVKDLWYELQLLAPVCGSVVAGHASDAQELGDLLGDDHDLAVLRAMLVRVGEDVAVDVEAVLGLLDHRRDELQASAMLVGRRVYAESQKAFRRRMRRLVEAGWAQARHAENRQPAELAEVTRPLPAG